MTVAQMKKTLESLSTGDRVAITTKKYGRRELTVNEDPQTMAMGSLYVGVTSGKPWGDRKIRGGAISYHDWDPPVVRFQPTMNQTAETVTSLEKIGVSHNNPKSDRERRNIALPDNLIDPIMNWHGGQGTALYALGSSEYVSKEMIGDAIGDLGAAKRKASGAQRQELDMLISDLEDVITYAEQWTVEGVDENPRRKGRQKNSHDRGKSERDAMSAITRTNSDLVAANEALEKGNLQRSVQQLLLTAFFLGEARTHYRYAGISQDERVNELIEHLKDGDWSKAIAGYCKSAAANPKKRNAETELSDDEDELVLYIDNTESLYNQYSAIAQRLIAKKKLGSTGPSHLRYSPTRARGVFSRLVSQAAEQYRADIDRSTKWTSKQRENVTKYLVQRFEEQYDRGEIGARNPRKKRTARKGRRASRR